MSFKSKNSNKKDEKKINKNENVLHDFPSSSSDTNSPFPSQVAAGWRHSRHRVALWLSLATHLWH